MHVLEWLGLEKLKLKQMDRAVETPNAWKSKQQPTIGNLRKRLSSNGFSRLVSEEGEQQRIQSIGCSCYAGLEAFVVDKLVRCGGSAMMYIFGEGIDLELVLNITVGKIWLWGKRHGINTGCVF